MSVSTDHNLAKQSAPVCHACGGTVGRVYPVREMMFGLRHKFEYFECVGCGGVQLIDPPVDWEPYYPANYYSYSSADDDLYPLPAGWLMWSIYCRRNDAQIFNRSGFFGWLARRRPRLGLTSDWSQFADLPVQSLRDPVLDVGCGQGTMLRRMASVGFSSLVGCDPFLPADMQVGHGLRIYARRLADLPTEQFALIMFHHSLEHMADPEAELREAAKRLRSGGCCLVRIPVIGAPWREYQSDWVELDAPRHHFLHTERSLALIAARAGLKVDQVTYDSDGFAYWGSELYRRDLPLHQTPDTGHRDFGECFTPTEFSASNAKALVDNTRGDGGRAAFVLRKL